VNGGTLVPWSEISLSPVATAAGQFALGLNAAARTAMRGPGVCVSPGRCARPGLAAGGHATLVAGGAAAVIEVLTAGTALRRRMNAPAAPISDRPASPNAQIDAM
jgi:hypothetical protein